MSARDVIGSFRDLRHSPAAALGSVVWGLSSSRGFFFFSILSDAAEKSRTRACDEFRSGDLDACSWFHFRTSSASRQTTNRRRPENVCRPRFTPRSTNTKNGRRDDSRASTARHMTTVTTTMTTTIRGGRRTKFRRGFLKIKIIL